jgi:hypothetical protein
VPTVNPKPPTARERALAALAEHPDGLSKNQLRDLLDVNAGVFRRLIMSMEDKDEITITEEHNPNWGPTKIVRAKEAAAA